MKSVTFSIFTKEILMAKSATLSPFTSPSGARSSPVSTKSQLTKMARIAGSKAPFLLDFDCASSHEAFYIISVNSL
jgi:hypothetical protein